MISINELRGGIFIKWGGELYIVVNSQHYKPGKGGAFVRSKLKSIRTGNTIDRTFRPADLIEEIFIEERDYNYMYYDGLYHFMDNETYEQTALPEAIVGEAAKYLKENVQVTAQIHDAKVLSVKLPLFLKFKIIETEPGVRGDTVKAGTKSAKIETGATIQVPLFIENGEIITVDTRTGKYTGRA
ncbi:MAG: elongation factor P [Candidatus Omnitrophota bacterium]